MLGWMRGVGRHFDMAAHFVPVVIIETVPSAL